jgi:catechol 2,3-dioxygenase-like lactoylglutathione lyase family enzyme
LAIFQRGDQKPLNLTKENIGDMATRVHHIHHVAKDPQVAADFYIEHFGGKLFTPAMDYVGSTYMSVMLDGVEIRIRGLRLTDNDEIVKVGRGLHHFGIQVDDLDAVAERLEKAGVEFTKKPGPGVLGSKTSFIKAPDDVLIELVEEP